MHKYPFDEKKVNKKNAICNFVFICTIERDIWKQKYLLEKKKTTELEDKIKETTVNSLEIEYLN